MAMQGECGVQAALGEDCSFDPDYGCAVGKAHQCPHCCLVR